MPHAETSPLRIKRLKNDLSQRRLAEMAGISASTISTIERLRNRVAQLEAGTHSQTNVEVVTRLLAALGYIDYGREYSPSELARLGKRVFLKREITERGRRPSKPYPGVHIRVNAA